MGQRRRAKPHTILVDAAQQHPNKRGMAHTQVCQPAAATGDKAPLYTHFNGNLYGGGTYWSMSRKAIGIALDYMDKHPDYLHRFRHTSIAEEICLHTIWCNSSLPIINNYMRYIDWGLDGGNPQVLTEKDFDKIIASGSLFARKMANVVSDKLIEALKYHE